MGKQVFVRVSITKRAIKEALGDHVAVMFTQALLTLKEKGCVPTRIVWVDNGLATEFSEPHWCVIGEQGV